MSVFAVEHRECSRCRQTRPIDAFPFRKNRGKHATHCKTCVREKAREVQRKKRANPATRQTLMESNARYARSPRGKEAKRRKTLIDNHKRRAPHLPFLWSYEKWEKCLAAWSMACAYCGRTGMRLTQDHVIPLTDPSCPGTVPWNIVPACMPCNSRKHSSHKAPALVVAYLENLAPYL